MKRFVRVPLAQPAEGALWAASRPTRRFRRFTVTIAVKWQRLEGGIILLSCLGIYLSDTGAVPWWAALMIFFAPDLSLLAYAFGPRVGAFAYNAVHVYALGLAVIMPALILENPAMLASGALLCAHAGFDRLLGYGLKSPDGFTHTHLGEIGRASRSPPRGRRRI
jgi:hypothetical protein